MIGLMTYPIQKGISGGDKGAFEVASEVCHSLGANVIGPLSGRLVSGIEWNKSYSMDRTINTTANQST